MGWMRIAVSANPGPGLTMECLLVTKKEMARRIAADLGIDQTLAGKIVQSTLDLIIESAVAVAWDRIDGEKLQPADAL